MTDASLRRMLGWTAAVAAAAFPVAWLLDAPAAVIGGLVAVVGSSLALRVAAGIGEGHLDWTSTARSGPPSGESRPPGLYRRLRDAVAAPIAALLRGRED